MTKFVGSFIGGAIGATVGGALGGPFGKVPVFTCLEQTQAGHHCLVILMANIILTKHTLHAFWGEAIVICMYSNVNNYVTFLFNYQKCVLPIFSKNL